MLLCVYDVWEMWHVSAIDLNSFLGFIKAANACFIMTLVVLTFDPAVNQANKSIGHLYTKFGSNPSTRSEVMC